jgi:hypothetical protein
MKIFRRKAIRNSIVAASGTAFISGIPQDWYGSTKEKSLKTYQCQKK